MHNGRFHKLRDVLDFYAERDSKPRKWYPHGAAPYDDLPAEYRGNVNQERPFGRKAGSAPALDASEIDDVLAFLDTLTDADLVKQ